MKLTTATKTTAPVNTAETCPKKKAINNAIGKIIPPPRKVIRV